MAKTGDPDLATSGDFFMATDSFGGRPARVRLAYFGKRAQQPNAAVSDATPQTKTK